MSLSVLPASFRRSQSFLMRLRQRSSSSASLLAHGGLFAIELVGFVDAEIEALRQQRARVRDALADALLVEIEDRERRGEVLIVDRIVELGLVIAEAVDVGLREEQTIAVERVEIAREDLLRHRVVERHGLVVEFGQESRRPNRGFCPRPASASPGAACPHRSPDSRTRVRPVRPGSAPTTTSASHLSTAIHEGSRLLDLFRRTELTTTFDLISRFD